MAMIANSGCGAFMCMVQSGSLVLGVAILILSVPAFVECESRPPGGGPGGGRPPLSRTPPPTRVPPPASPHTPTPGLMRTGTSDPKPPSMPPACHQASDCSGPFECKLGRCVPDHDDMSGMETEQCRGRTVLQILHAHRNISRMFLSGLRAAFGTEILNLLNDTRARLTVFAPTNLAFARVLNSSTEVAVHANSECLRAALRLHIVLRPFNSTQLVSARRIGTLQGWDVAVSSSPTGRPFPFLQVVTNSTKSQARVRLIHPSDLLACNGIVHFVDNVLVPRSMLPDTQQKSVIDAIRAYPTLSVFSKALQDTKMASVLTPAGQYTVFAPSNNAFRRLGLAQGNRSLTDLQQQEQLRELVGLVRSHIAAMPYTIVDLGRMAANRIPVRSLGGQLVNGSVNILSNASLTIHNVSLIQSNITASNGIIHILDGVFSLAYPSNRCVKEMIRTVPGKCTSCPPGGDPNSKISCPQGLPSGRTTREGCGKHECRYTHCVEVTKTLTCCGGYYSSSCLSCPGGVVNPCNGQGTCHDGIAGDGKCDCESGYSGQACDQHIRPSEGDIPVLIRPSTSAEFSPPPKAKDSPDSSSAKKSSRTEYSEYFLIPLSIGATLAVLVIVAGIVLWRMKRRLVSISETRVTRVPTPTPDMPRDMQIVPGMPDAVVCRQPGGREFVVVSPSSVAFHASPSGTTMESIPEEESASSERVSMKDERASLSNVSMSELVPNQHPMGSNKGEYSPTDSLEATSSNELLDR